MSFTRINILLNVIDFSFQSKFTSKNLFYSNTKAEKFEFIFHRVLWTL